MKNTTSLPAPAAPPVPAPLPGETPRAFAAFQAYQELGPSRSLPLLAEHLGESHDTLRRWSSRHRWHARLTDLQSAHWQQQLAGATVAATVAAADWAARSQALREQQWAIAQQLLAAARCFLESFGETQLERMTLSQVSRAVHISSLLARHAAQPSDAATVPGLSQIQVDMLAALHRAYGPPAATHPSNPAAGADSPPPADPLPQPSTD